MAEDVLTFKFVVKDENVQVGLERFLVEAPRTIRRHANQWGFVLVNIAKDLSPEDKVRAMGDPRRRPKSDQLKFKWRHEVDQSAAGRRTTLAVGNEDQWIEAVIKGTPAQIIYGKGLRPMVFWWPRLGIGPVSAWVIEKPATAPNPVHELAFEEFDLDDQLPDLANDLVSVF